MQASNYMNVPALFELCCAKVASDYKGKSFNEIKKKYGLEDVQFTPEDEAAILAKYPWITKETQKKIDKMREASGVGA